MSDTEYLIDRGWSVVRGRFLRPGYEHGDITHGDAASAMGEQLARERLAEDRLLEACEGTGYLRDADFGCPDAPPGDWEH